MANLDYVTSNKLTLEADEQKHSSQKAVLIGGAVLALVALFVHVYAAMVVVAVVLILYASQNGSETLRAGAVGEDIAMQVLSQLPDTYTIYNQVDIPNEKSRTGYNEADVIVMGPDAIFVVEVKHNNGSITGSETDREWHVQKMGRGGTPYSKTMRNPIAQVKKLTWLLSQDMKKRNSRAWVQGIVLFSNSDVSVSVNNNGNVPVFGLNQVNSYILGFTANTRMTNSLIIKQGLAQLKAA